MTVLGKLDKVLALRRQRQILAAGQAAFARQEAAQQAGKLSALDDLHQERQDAASDRLRQAVTNAETMRNPEARFGSIALSMMLLQDELARIVHAVDEQTAKVKDAKEVAKERQKAALAAMRAKIKCDRMAERLSQKATAMAAAQEEDVLQEMWPALKKGKSHA